MDNAQIAEHFFTAITKGDIESLRVICAPDLESRQNDNPPMSLDDLLGLIQVVTKMAPDFRYENALRSATATGFVEEHDACLTLPDGKQFRQRVCVVADVNNGKIQNLREYMDSKTARPLMEALTA